MAELRLERARFLRYIWDYEAALAEYEALRSHTRDRVVDVNCRLGQARTLVDMAEFTSNSQIEGKLRAQQAIARLGGLYTTSLSGALIGLRADVEVEEDVPCKSLRDLVFEISRYDSYANFRANEHDLIQVVVAELAASGKYSHVSLVLEALTTDQVLLDMGSVLFRAGELNVQDALTYLRSSLLLIEGSRVLRNSKVLARHPFLEAKVLLLASRVAASPSPMGWASRYDLEISDLEYAFRRIQSAYNRTVGGFQTRVVELSRELSANAATFGLAIPALKGH
jgi:hypothetical protein